MTTEINSLLPTPETLTLESGFQVSVSRVKTVQLLRLVRIFANGGGIDNLLFAFNNSETEQEQVTNVVSALVLSIPAAEAETLSFIRSLVEPAHLRPDNKSQADRNFNEEQYEKLAEDMVNPSIEDLMKILEVVVRREIPEFKSLGKRLVALLSIAKPQTEKTTE